MIVERDDEVPNFDLIKVAVTREDILRYKLPPIPAKQSDPRYARFVANHGVDSVKLDALPPDILRQKVREAIKVYIDVDKLLETIEREKEEGEEIESLLSGT